MRTHTHTQAQITCLKVLFWNFIIKLVWAYHGESGSFRCWFTVPKYFENVLTTLRMNGMTSLLGSILFWMNLKWFYWIEHSLFWFERIFSHFLFIRERTLKIFYSNTFMSLLLPIDRLKWPCRLKNRFQYILFRRFFFCSFSKIFTQCHPT